MLFVFWCDSDELLPAVCCGLLLVLLVVLFLCLRLDFAFEFVWNSGSYFGGLELLFPNALAKRVSLWADIVGVCIQFALLAAVSLLC